VHAPDLTGLLGRRVHLADGRELTADEPYIRDSILVPAKDVVAGHAPIMPSFAGQIGEEDILAIIEYIRESAHDELPRGRR
jgi:cytochrome c oxidase subunit 2